MKLAVCLALFVSAFAVWGQDAPADPPSAPPAAAADSSAPLGDQPPAAPSVPDRPWKVSLDVAVRSGILVPAFNSIDSFQTGGFAGAELAVPLPDKAWHIRTGVDVGSITMNGERFFIAAVKPGLSYDAFFGPTAFMTFEVEGGWMTATAMNLAVSGGQACAGAGTSVSFYLGDHVNFRTDLRYLEIFGTAHLVSLAIGFDVIGN